MQGGRGTIIPRARAAARSREERAVLLGLRRYRFRSDETLGPERGKRRRTSRPSRARGQAPFFSFFSAAASGGSRPVLLLSCARTRKQDMSYAEPLWEINGNQAPVSPPGERPIAVRGGALFLPKRREERNERGLTGKRAKRGCQDYNRVTIAPF